MDEEMSRLVNKKVTQVKRLERKLSETRKNRWKKKLTSTISRLKEEVQEVHPDMEWPKQEVKEVEREVKQPETAPPEEPKESAPVEERPSEESGEAPAAVRMLATVCFTLAIPMVWFELVYSN